jgi:hypothetical protein
VSALPTYTFLPWVRRGLARAIETPDPLGGPSALIERASVRVTVGVGGEPIRHDVALLGPGDILGISPRAIVRTEPRGWITNFEPNYLPFVEFYDEDFPWRYTPAHATAAHRLRPWIALIVLTEDEFTDGSGPGGPLPAIKLAGEPSRLFPPARQTWAWAHVHVNQDISAAGSRSPAETVSALDALVRENPDAAYSRLLCPRRLEPNTPYHAFVVPAFETGRLAWLGLPTAGVDALRPAWGAGQTDYPVYYRWFFRTGERGDFELLANLLQPRPVDERVGIRDMDVQAPNFGVAGLVNPPVLGLEGALRRPGAVSRPAAWPPSPRPALVRELQARVNRQAEALALPAGGGHPDPVISPPLYGRWHAMVARLAVGQPGWVNELNADPRLRVAAGLGARVVAAHQEDYMQRAWAQLGDVLAANQLIRRAQLSILASHQLYARSLLALDAEQLVATTHAVLRRVVADQQTLDRHIRRSRLPAAAVGPGFRKLARPRGVLMRKAALGDGRRLPDLVRRLNDGRLSAAPALATPARLITLDAAATAVTAVPRAPARARERALAADRLREVGLTRSAVESLPSRPGFVITEPGASAPVTPAAPGADSAEAASLRSALTALHQRLQVALPAPPAAVPLDVEATARTIAAALHPARTIPARIRSVVAFPGRPRPGRPPDTFAPVMAYPSFADPMYAPLRDLSSELLVPNLGLIPDNTICLLETNRRFVEAYMVGLNDEMAHELLWREYPTDQRGSYFRQFWDVGDVLSRDPATSAKAREESLRDITPLHTWGPDTALGTHENRDLPSGDEASAARVVLAIRGELLKRYPTTVVFAQKARWGTDELGRSVRLLDTSDPEHNLLEPRFKAEVEPDIHFLGFDLTAAAARGSAVVADADPGWFFVLQQRPGEPRFGMDFERPGTPAVPTRWDDLAWSHLGPPGTVDHIDLDTAPTTTIVTEPDRSVAWGANAADMAFILYQTPVMVAFHAQDMLR